MRDAMSLSAWPTRAICDRPCGSSVAEPGSNRTSAWKDEAVADDAHVAAVAERLADLAEELGAVARQLLDLAGEREVEPPAEIDDLRLLFLGLEVGGVERGLEPAELLLQRVDLPRQQVDARLRVGAELALGGERGGAARALRLERLRPRLELRGPPREILLQLVAQDRQRLDVPAQRVELAQLDVDLLLVRRRST
jgi:hypothetical protein